MNIKTPISLSFLQQPYPYYYKGKYLIYFALIIFSMSLLFNYLFEPFVVYYPEHKLSYIWISFIHSINAFLVVLLVLWTTSQIINEDHWVVRKELLLFSLLFLMIGISQFLIRDFIYDNPENWSIRYLLEEIRNTFLAGTLFMFIILPINYIRLQGKHTYTAEKINTKSKTIKNSYRTKIIPISTQQKSDDFQLNLSEFLFAKSDGNYLEVFLEKDSQIKKSIKRMSLKELETQLASHPQFIKTHRSYIINLEKVKHVKGNAQGYLISLENFPEALPVSRGMIAAFESAIITT